MNMLTIVSIGPGDPALLNLRTTEVLKAAETLILRTGRHPITEWLSKNGVPWSSLDDLYETETDFDILYNRIAESVLEHSGEKRTVYAVPDILTDRSLDMLYAKAMETGTVIETIPGFSYADYYLANARNDLCKGNVRISSAQDLFSLPYDPSLPLLVTELDNALLAGDVKQYIGNMSDDEISVSFLNGNVRSRIPLYELDRQKSYDHLTAVLVPGSDYRSRDRYTIYDLMEIMNTLRSPHGCPWDRAQTHATLKPYLVEEAWETVAAIDSADTVHLAEELGDLLFQIVFHASIGESYDEFTINDIISAICSKMIRRHPHVFGNESFGTAKEVSEHWEQLKNMETGRLKASECMDDVSEALPSLKYAVKLHKKAAVIPLWRRDPADTARDIASLAGDLMNQDGTLNENILGKMLLVTAHLCQLCGSDPETVLHCAADRFRAHFRNAELLAEKDGKTFESLTFSELCVYLRHVEGEIE